MQKINLPGKASKPAKCPEERRCCSHWWRPRPASGSPRTACRRCRSRFARLRTPELDDYAIGYTRILTAVWVSFFIANGSIAAWTALYASIDTWTLYNGLISYVLIAVLFVGEWPVRRILRARHDRKTQGSTGQENA